MGLTRYLIRRLIFLVFLIIGVTFLVFIITSFVPGDPIAVRLSSRNLNNPEIIESFEEKWGLDKPLHQQYFIYLKNLIKGDMGTSIRTQNSVIKDLIKAYPATVELAILAIIIAVFFGILFGIISAIFRNSFIDQILRAISVLGVSLPSFWFALITLYIFYYRLGWAAGPGRLSAFLQPPPTTTHLYVIDSIIQGNWSLALDSLSHLILPAIVLGAFTMGLITRTTRSSLLEVMSKHYIRTARSKGLTEKMVVIRHAFGNALIPVITVIGVGFANLLGGTVLVETIFAWPGIGQYAYKSAISLDFPAIVGVSLIIAFNYLFINLFIDILYGIIDPRVRYE